MGVENANGADFVGILAEPIAATDDDYATAGKLKGVWVPEDATAEAGFTVVNGTFTTADIGKTAKRTLSQHLLALQSTLCEKLSTKVKIKGSTDKGKIIIPYKTREELEKLHSLLSRK